MDRSLIDRLHADANVPLLAIEDLSDADLLAKPIEGRWSIQQLIVHLMDSHLVGAWRMRKVIAEDNPLLMGYDCDRFVERLAYETTSARAAAEVFRTVQQLTAEVLNGLPDATFRRTGIHSETGKVTLEALVHTYVAHLEHHMRFLREKRTMLGKPLQ